MDSINKRSEERPISEAESIAENLAAAVRTALKFTSHPHFHIRVGECELAPSVIGSGILPIANFVGKLTCYLGDGCDSDT